MASIFKRGDLQWMARIRRQGHKPVSKTFDTKADAEAWARSIEREMDRGAFIPSDAAQRKTVKEVLEKYRDEVLPRLSKGAKPDRSRIARLVEDFGGLNLAALDSSHVAAYRDRRLYNEGASPQTVKHELGLLNRVLKQCVIDWGIHLPRGIVTTHVRKPALPQGRDRRLFLDEEKWLLEAAKASRCKEIEPLIIIAVETAARRGEISAMTWANIDLKKRTWHIPIEDTKTSTPRTVPLSTRAVEVLSALPRRLDGRVWTMKRADGITQAFDRLCKARPKKGNKIEVVERFRDLNYHDLRHEGTSRLFEKGLSIMEVASITGHKDLRVLRRYTHLRAEDLAVKLG
jgi:integrase